MSNDVLMLRVDHDNAKVIKRLAAYIGLSTDEVGNLMLNAQANRLRAKATESHLASVFSEEEEPEPVKALKPVKVLDNPAVSSAEELEQAVRVHWVDDGMRNKTQIGKLMGIPEGRVRRILKRLQLK